MKIKIVTMNSEYNFGAVLQAYALQTTLNKMGHESEFIDQRRHTQKKVFVKKDFKNLFKIPYGFFYRRHLEEGYRNFERFVENEQQLTRYNYKDYNELVKNPPEADAFITGSDQVWNPNVLKPINFLDFAPKHIKKISYAASLGVSRIPEEKIQQFIKYIDKIDFISVRERSAKEIVGQLTNKVIHVNVDPVFLLSKEQWKHLEEPVDAIDYPYILCYILYRPKWLNKQLKELHKKTGLDIVLVHNDSYRNVFHTKVVRNAGPKQFLWLMRKADMVITSSFHGTAFASIFNKPFYSMVNPDRPSRIYDLLDLLQLKDRLLEGGNDLTPTLYMNYEKVNEIIEYEKTNSIGYLKNALSETKE